MKIVTLKIKFFLIFKITLSAPGAVRSSDIGGRKQQNTQFMNNSNNNNSNNKR